MDTRCNHILLRGTLEQPPAFSHENHGTRFYRFLLLVPRLSGTADTLPVLASEQLLQDTPLTDGGWIEVAGQLRSYNSRSETGRRLILSVYARTLRVCDGAPENLAELTGTVCKAPVYRRTPLGREICDVMLAVNRSYHRSDYLPVILWGRSAKALSELRIGQALHLTGRLQSRIYQKQTPEGVFERTAYEVSAVTAELAAPEEE